MFKPLRLRIPEHIRRGLASKAAAFLTSLPYTRRRSLWVDKLVQVMGEAQGVLVGDPGQSDVLLLIDMLDIQQDEIDTADELLQLLIVLARYHITVGVQTGVDPLEVHHLWPPHLSKASLCHTAPNQAPQSSPNATIPVHPLQLLSANAGRPFSIHKKYTPFSSPDKLSHSDNLNRDYIRTDPGGFHLFFVFPDLLPFYPDSP